MAIRGLIFDFGGVISNMRWDVAQELEEKHGLERHAIARTLFASEEWDEIQLGRGDLDAWREAGQRQLEEMAGRKLPPLHQQWREASGLIEQNIELIARLRPPYRVALLSNADISLPERIQDGLGIGHLFDTLVCSAVEGIAKPDHGIYRLAAERLDLPAEECVFIDDAERNVVAAREVGMEAIHYRVDSGDDLAEQLAALGVSQGADLG